MTKKKSSDQMALFEMGGQEEPVKPPAPPREEKKPTRAKPPKTTARKPQRPSPAKKKQRGSGLVPEGDVRLTANIREDLHLRLKIAAAKQRTTIGELIEELVEKYI